VNNSQLQLSKIVDYWLLLLNLNTVQVLKMSFLRSMLKGKDVVFSLRELSRYNFFVSISLIQNTRKGKMYQIVKY
jgi:hypothetical protein